jgi:hypothetical protein
VAVAAGVFSRLRKRSACLRSSLRPVLRFASCGRGRALLRVRSLVLRVAFCVLLGLLVFENLCRRLAAAGFLKFCAVFALFARVFALKIS